MYTNSPTHQSSASLCALSRGCRSRSMSSSRTLTQAMIELLGFRSLAYLRSFCLLYSFFSISDTLCTCMLTGTYVSRAYRHSSLRHHVEACIKTSMGGFGNTENTRRQGERKNHTPRMSGLTLFRVCSSLDTDSSMIRLQIAVCRALNFLRAMNDIQNRVQTSRLRSKL